MIKFTNAKICRNNDANEILVKNGIIHAIGNNLRATEDT